MANTLIGRLTPTNNMGGTLTNESRLTGQLGGVGAVVTYASLPDKPSINNVELVGNKTTSDLKISYNDLRDQPVIPDVGEIDERLDDLESDTSALDGRLTTAEENITSLSGRVTTAEGNITTLQGDTGALDTRLTTAEGNITSLDGRVTTNEGDISDLQGDVSQAQSDISQLNSSLTYKSITIPSSNINSKITVNRVYGGVRGGVAEFYLQGVANASIATWESLVTALPNELKPRETNNAYFININNILYVCNLNQDGLLNTPQAISKGQIIRFKATYIPIN